MIRKMFFKSFLLSMLLMCVSTLEPALADEKVAQQTQPIGSSGSKPITLNDVIVECWGNDLTDGKIGGWKSTYPHCILDDGEGRSNAIYDGVLSIAEDNRLCITMKNLSTADPPRHTLSVGFRITLKTGTFRDGTKTKGVEMARFSYRPSGRPITKCTHIIASAEDRQTKTKPGLEEERPQAGQEIAPVPQQREPAQAKQEVARVPQPLKNKQTWSGYYVCKQGTTSLILRINSVTEIKNTDILNVEAIFDFDYANGRTVGKSNLYGQYNPKNRTLLLNPGEWIQRPPGYESVGMDGKISSDGKHYTGKIRSPSAGCSEFNVSLDERPQGERKVAQAPQQREPAQAEQKVTQVPQQQEPAQKGALPKPAGKQAPTGTSDNKGTQAAGGAAGALACLGLSGACLFVPIGIFVLNLALMIWVVKDAKARGTGSPIGWLILVMLTGVVGLIIYFFSRPKGELVECPNCKNKRLQAMDKCPHCGK